MLDAVIWYETESPYTALNVRALVIVGVATLVIVPVKPVGCVKE